MEDRFHVDNQVIFEEGEEGDCMYILVQGKMKVTSGGSEVGTLEDGAIFGELAVLGAVSKRSATVVCVTACRVKVAYQAVVARALVKYPEDAAQLKKFALERLESIRNARSDLELDQLSFFSHCSKTFTAEVAKILTQHMYLPDIDIVSQGE